MTSPILYGKNCIFNVSQFKVFTYMKRKVNEAIPTLNYETSRRVRAGIKASVVRCIASMKE